MSEVVKHDFGKDAREASRAFCRLMGLLEKHEADVLANPTKYLRDAEREIVQLRTEIFQIWEIAALMYQVSINEKDHFSFPKTVVVDAREYEALRAMKRRITKLAGMG